MRIRNQKWFNKDATDVHQPIPVCYPCSNVGYTVEPSKDITCDLRLWVTLSLNAHVQQMCWSTVCSTWINNRMSHSRCYHAWRSTGTSRRLYSTCLLNAATAVYADLLFTFFQVRTGSLPRWSVLIVIWVILHSTRNVEHREFYHTFS